MNFFGDMLIVVVIAFGILLGIGLFIWWMIRDLVLWYLRINEIVALLEKIEQNTRSGSKEASTEVTDKKAVYISSPVDLSSKPASSSGRRCRDCSAELPRNVEFCPKCLAPVR